MGLRVHVCHSTCMTVRRQLNGSRGLVLYIIYLYFISCSLYFCVFVFLSPLASFDLLSTLPNMEVIKTACLLLAYAWSAAFWHLTPSFWLSLLVAWVYWRQHILFSSCTCVWCICLVSVWSRVCVYIYMWRPMIDVGVFWKYYFPISFKRELSFM